MPTDVIMPQMGESIFEGTITKWLKKPGNKSRREEPLFEISTDKVDAEIPAPASGVLQEIKVGEGNTVQVNTVVGTIASDGEAGSAPAKPTTAAPAAAPAERPPAQAAKRAGTGRGGRITKQDILDFIEKGQRPGAAPHPASAAAPAPVSRPTPAPA